MCSVKNEDDEPFKTAAAAVARERVATARSMWASVEARLALQIKLTAWTCKLGGRSRQSCKSLQNEGPWFSSAERAFSTRSSTQKTAGHLVFCLPGADRRRRPVREREGPSRRGTRPAGPRSTLYCERSVKGPGRQEPRRFAPRSTAPSQRVDKCYP